MLRKATSISFALILLIFLAAGGVLGFFTLTVAGLGEVPDIDTPLTSTFYYHDGQVLTTRFEQNRFELAYEDIPDRLKEAFIAVEDRRFFRHFGIDPIGLSRAMLRNIRTGRFKEGASTITQQLARNLFLTHEKTVSRKIQEAILTLQLERTYSKQEILEMYLNTIYFGYGAYGVEAASRTYFGKPVSELSLAEMAMLAGIPRGPAYYSPFNDFEAAKNRQKLVLASMVEAGFITEEEKEEALAEEIVLADRSRQRALQQTGAYFIDYLISQEIPRIFPDDPQIVYRGGLHIYTTLDKKAQEAAEKAVAENLPVTSVNERGVEQPQVALVAMDPQTGAVRALLGGRDFSNTQYNRAIPPNGSGRSPGSAFKPFAYAAALEAGYTPASTHTSEPVSFTIPGQAAPYEPTEYGGNYFYRPLRMREALALSSNVVAVKTHMDIGPDLTVEMARRLGIKSPLNNYASLPLGTSDVTPLEMAAAYSAFANQGIRVEPLFIEKITDSRGRVLYENRPTRVPVLDPRIAYLVTDMLKSVLGSEGTASGLGSALSRPAAAKTGTSQDHRDAYIVGLTPQLTTAVWVGNDDNSSLGWGQTGSRVAGPIWLSFINEALRDAEVLDFERPEGLVEADICPYSGLLNNPACGVPAVRELFIAGTEPAEICRPAYCIHCPSNLQWHWGGWGRW